jgi:hypothetical protein
MSLLVADFPDGVFFDPERGSSSQRVIETICLTSEDQTEAILSGQG